MTTLWRDVRYAVRGLWKAPGFTAIALLTLALGIGANTVMFSISDQLLRRVPRMVRDPEQLAYCAIQGKEDSWFRYSEYVTVRDSALGFSDLMAEAKDLGWAWHTTMAHGDLAWHTPASYVSANYFSTLGVALVVGRGFLPEEERAGTAPVVILSHRCWRRLGGSSNIVGEFVSLNGTRCQVVGVAPKGFTGVTFQGPDLWLPLGSYETTSTWARRMKGKPEGQYPKLHLIGRIKRGLTMSAAQMRLQRLFPDFRPEYLPDDVSLTPSIKLRAPGRLQVEMEGDHDRSRKALFSLALTATSAIILMVACLNVANMLVIKGGSRNREFAIRMALGGGRWHIIRQLLTESLLLALVGGVLGIMLAFWGIRVLNAWITGSPDQYTRGFQSGLSLCVLLLTLGACLLATLLSGLRPALRLSKSDIIGEMKVSTGRVVGGGRKRRAAVSVVGQIALAVALVFVATLLTRSAIKMVTPDSRFCLDDKLVVQIDWDSTQYERTRNVQISRAVADHLASLPGVEALGASTGFFFGGGGHLSISEYGVEAGEKRRNRPVAQRVATPNVGWDYFTALGIPLLQGRFFDKRDYALNGERVAMIDESLAHKLRPDGNALGCLIVWSFMGDHSDPYRVVGIVSHLPEVGSEEVHAQMYSPTSPDELCSCFYLHAVNERSMELLRQHIVQEIHAVDARIPVLTVATLAEMRDNEYAVWQARFCARLGQAAGIVALFLATLGIYAVKGHMVVSRTSEIGVRKALGATHRDIMGMVLREGLVLTVVGVVVGLGLGLAAARLLTSMFYGINSVDPFSIIAAVALLGSVSLLASYIPARRASCVDPMEALRSE